MALVHSNKYSDDHSLGMEGCFGAFILGKNFARFTRMFHRGQSSVMASIRFAVH